MASLGLALLVAAFKFCVVILAVYIGTTLALRGFFGREYPDPRTGTRVGGTEGDSESGTDTPADRRGT